MKHEIFTKELELIKDERIRKNTEIILDLLPEYFYHIPASSTGKYHPNFSLGEGGLVRHVKVATRILNDLLNDTTYINNYAPYIDKNKESKLNEKDLMLMGIILHDGLKDGLLDFDYKEEEENQNKLTELKNKRDELLKNDIGNNEIDTIKKEISALYKKVHFTKFEHPILISNFIKSNKDKLDINEEELKFLCNILETHMGGLDTTGMNVDSETKQRLEFHKQYKQAWNDEIKKYESTDTIEYELPTPKNKYQHLVHTADFLSSRKYLNVNFENNDIVER